MASQQFSPFLITNLSCLVIMPTAVEFDRQFRSRTIEIEDVGIDRVLSPKLVTCKIAVSETAPENLLAICRLLSERCSAAHNEKIG